MVTLNVNGQIKRIDVEADMPLLWALREVLGMRVPSTAVALRSAARVLCTSMAHLRARAKYPHLVLLDKKL